MKPLKSFHQNASLRFLKICLCCFGIVGTAVITSGVLKFGVLDNDRQLDHAFRLLRPLSNGLDQIVQRLAF
ncbi:hypothetical protein [Pelagicoccus sp. SDUM812002]|uniref:hypothetical protein n=1 Tax=Pelagicoccus sp. SDUM812002 TaxID=3041266 RepID=UPI00280DB7AD|nr:hypothetical protein [Pelagicoccus sp. SDUM812002]MDQ8186733.1 hypothetical protein [Pelagicoccus sp. SDUM812002]